MTCQNESSQLLLLALWCLASLHVAAGVSKAKNQAECKPDNSLTMTPLAGFVV